MLSSPRSIVQKKSRVNGGGWVNCFIVNKKFILTVNFQYPFNN